MYLASNPIQEKLQLRARSLTKVRQFFQTRGVCEVDTPALIPYANIDQHINPIQTESGFLRTSPEYALKQLVAMGSSDIFEIGHVFRKGEKSTQHNPEFTMIEWYRVGFTMQQMITETIELIHLFCPHLTVYDWTYQQLFEKYININPHEGTFEELLQILPQTSPSFQEDEVDPILQFLFVEYIEPKLNKEIHVIRDFPQSQCALARIENNVAKRFEIYVNGREVANGYDELRSAKEQRRRFEKDNFLRAKQNKESFVIDEAFLKALDQLPACCGVAVGFDRLVMLEHNKTTIADVINIV